MDIINTLQKSFIQISKLIRGNNSLNLGNVTNNNNISGDNMKILDLESNKILKNNLSKCKEVRCIGSEEEPEFYYTDYSKAPYLVCYDPLDGSSNIDVNITTGTIFAVYQYNNNKIENGRNIIMAGYCLYGGATQYVIAYQQKVSMFQYSEQVKKFVLLLDNLKIKKKGTIYSINESNKYCWNDLKYQKIVNHFIRNNYTNRWVASMVADAHRTIIKGGFFSYPGNKKNPDGKIRLIYEAYPFAYIFELAGGKSSNGHICLLDVPFPTALHQKTPIVLGGEYEMSVFRNI